MIGPNQARVAYEAHLASAVAGFLVLAPGSQAECQRFTTLALAAHDFAVAERLPFGWVDPYDPAAFYDVINAASRAPRRAAASSVAAWKAWEAIRRDLARRHPRLALFDLIHEISQSALSLRWPAGIEGQFQDWADQEDYWPPAYCLRMTGRHEAWLRTLQDWHGRLRQLRQQLDGWFESTAGDVRFVPEDEWQRLRTSGLQG